MAVATYTKTIVGVFNSVQDAQGAVQDLENSGISRDDISIVANKNAAGYETMDSSDKASNVVADAGIGAAIGGVGGLLLSAAGAITIPVIGPILAAGPIAAALTGAGIGAAAGGLIGALTESGIPEEHARYYAEGVRRGDVLVTVKTDNARADRVCDILDNHDAVDVDERVSSWRERGWTGYSSEAAPLSDEELRNERLNYKTGYGTGYGTGRSASPLDRPGSPADLDKDNDANAMERGAYRAKEGLKEMGRDIKEMGRDAADAMRRTGDKVGDTARDLRDDARETSDRMENERRRRVRIYDRTL